MASKQNWRSLSSERLALSRITGKRIDRRHAPTPAEKRQLTKNRLKIELFLSGNRSVTASAQRKAAKNAERYKDAFLDFLNGKTRAGAAKANGISTKDFEAYIGEMHKGAQKPKAYEKSVYNTKGRRIEAYFAGADLTMQQNYKSLIERIDRGEASPAELKRFEGVKLQSVKKGKRGIIKDREITLTGDYSKIIEDRERRAALAAHFTEEKYRSLELEIA